jgi:Bacterial type III secretion protein (HrpB1_HrpK)
MDTEQGYSPTCIALKHLVGACIDEEYLEEAEAIYNYLDMVRFAPQMRGLVYVWIRTQRGDWTEALRRCNELSEEYPDVEAFKPMLLILRFCNRDPSWRGLCERMIASPTSTEASKRIATSMLNGTFGRPSQAAEPEEPTQQMEEKAAPADTFDYASSFNYMRA